MRVLILILALLPGLALADDKLVRLYASEALVKSGLIKHIVPRFSLKTQVKIELVSEPNLAEMSLDTEGRALFAGLGETWAMDIRSETGGTAKFSDWLTSTVGKRTILGFAPDGAPLFSEPEVKEVEVAALEMSGDAVIGQTVSKSKCGRCHVTELSNRGGGIGSTPSFFVMRSFEDWELRFSGFYILKPHPAFTQIEEVTDPFPEDRPSPIAPIELSLDELEAILAYVAALAPADLGAPIKHQ